MRGCERECLQRVSLCTENVQNTGIGPLGHVLGHASAGQGRQFAPTLGGCLCAVWGRGSCGTLSVALPQAAVVAMLPAGGKQEAMCCCWQELVIGCISVH